MRRLLEYTNVTLPCQLQVVTFSDNQGMIKRLHDRDQYDNVYSNATLLSDWDLIEEIHQTYTTFGLIDHTYQWVRGHQDEDIEHQVKAEVLYNIRADKIAREHTYKQVLPRTMPGIVLPHTGCILHLHQEPCYGNYIPAIRRAAAKDEFQAYMKQRHDWTSDTINAIDWESFDHATRTYAGPQHQLLKLVHDKLPTNLQKSRYTPHVSPICHLCS